MMAFLMTGFFGVLHFGFTTGWLRERAQAFAIARPIACCLSLGSGRLGFKLADMITRH